MISPKTEAALSDAVKDATGPLRIIGAGTRPIGRVADGAVLSTSALTGITLYEPGAMTLVAGAGTPVAQIEAALAKENQQLAFEPMDHRTLLGTTGEPTIGGVVAANVSGPRRIQVGACRDHLLGVRYVDGSGELVSNGGRVMKNVTGYDLVKLMAGSRGTLGVLTEVSLKVMPKAPARATLRLCGLDGRQAMTAMTRAMRSPFDVNGAACVGGDVLLRVEGFDQSVAYRAEQLSQALNDIADVAVERDSAAQDLIWAGIRDVTALKYHPFVWRVAMTPSALYPGLFEQALQGLAYDTVIDWAGAQTWIGLTQAQADAVVDGAKGFHHLLQSALTDPLVTKNSGGHATLIKAPEPLRADVVNFQPEPVPLAAISAGLRAKFDPRGIFNPGLMT